MKNIAFFGVMASILSVAGAYAEDSSTPTTIIATKSYVDTKDATKADASTVSTHINNGDIHVTAAQKTSWTGKQDAITTTNKLSTDKISGLATVATSGSYNDLSNKPTIPTSSNFVTNGTNALSLSADTTKAPSVTAVKGIVTTNQRTATTGTDAAVDTLVPTEKAVATVLAGKQDTISDLATIRSNASAGAGAATTIGGYGNIVTHNTSEFATSTQGGKADTAVQTVKVNGTAVTKTSGAVDITVPTKVSDLSNDSSFATTTQVATAKSEAIAAAATDATTKANAKVSSATTISTTSTTTAPNEKAVSTALGLKANSADLAAVATSGSYSDLSNKPTIPAAQVQSDWNATTGMGVILNKPTLGTAAAKDTTDLYSSTGTDPVTGKGVAAAIAGLDSTKNATTNQVITGITQTDGKIASVTSTLITNNNIAAAGTANIEYAKMLAPTATINGGTAACSASAPCVLSYDGSSYSWTTFAY